MSGTVISAIQAVGQAFAGFGALTLGPVRFQPIELPHAMRVGGAQVVNKQLMPGGAKVLNVMGPDDDDKQWSGVFFGQDATSRIRLIDAIRIAGQPVTLAWDVFSYQVIVTHFTADTRANDAMPYQIVCMVIQDNSAPAGNSLTTIASQVVADMAQGQPLAALGAVANGAVAGPLGAAQGAVGAPNATVLGSADYKAAVAAVNGASVSINGALAQADAALGQYGTSLAALGAAAADTPFDAGPAVSAITGAVQNAGDAANLLQMRAYVGRTAVNLQNASS
jgi:hypothetical protein